jgi:hypothetical protein
MLVRGLIAIRVATDVPPARVSPDPTGVVRGASEARCEEEGVPMVEAVESVVKDGAPGEGTRAPVPTHRGHSHTTTAQAVHRGHTTVHRGHTTTARAMPMRGRSDRTHAQCRNGY